MPHLLRETGPYRPNPKCNLYSAAIHAGAILLLFAFASTQTIPDGVNTVIHLSHPILASLSLPSHGGGGGGGRMPLPASKGILPPRSTSQFVPPQAVLTNLDPKLTAQPTIIAPPDPTAPQVGVYGDPLGTLGILSDGPGSGFGIGPGKGARVGTGAGPNAGPGDCRDVGNAFTSGVDGVTAPIIIYRVDPQYSEEARKDKCSGKVILDFVVDSAGHTTCFHVARGSGCGLNEKAIEAVRRWRFKPGARGGKPVPVRARVEVGFHV